MKTFIFVNQSCYRRQEEIAMVRRFLFMNGFAEATDLTRTELVILFTCAFCQSRIVDMLNEIERIRSVMSEGCELIVGSCLPKTDAARLNEVFSGKTITPTDFSALNQLPGITMRIEELPGLPGGNGRAGLGRGDAETRRRGDWTSPSSPHLQSRLTELGGDGGSAPKMRQPSTHGAMPDLSLLKVTSKVDTDQRLGVFIASGCVRKCSYCAIRFATGPLRSKPLEVVTRTISEGLALGYRKFEIYADSIGDYGLDIGTDLGELFNWLFNNNMEFSIGIYDLHPQKFLKFFDEILSLCRAHKLHYLYVPVQSGNSRILQMMNRPCDLDALAKRLLEIKELDRVYLQTGIMVGFPSETDEEFEDTVTFLQAVQFHDVYVHFHSDMPDTASSRLPGKIGKEVMLRRLQRLQMAGVGHNHQGIRHEWENMSH